jgi:hypothetical protein
MYFDRQGDGQSYKIILVQGRNMKISIVIGFDRALIRQQKIKVLCEGKIEGLDTWKACQSCRKDLVSSRYSVSYFSCVYIVVFHRKNESQITLTEF